MPSADDRDLNLTDSTLNKFIYIPISDTDQAIVKAGTKKGYTFSLEDLPKLVDFAAKAMNQHPELELMLRRVIRGNETGEKEENTEENT